jgi:rubrerythrin
LRRVTTLDVFRCAERIEAIAAAIYAALAQQFADDAPVRALFARLEQEELQHAARVRLLASRYRADRKLLERFTGVTELQEGLRLSEEALSEVLAGAWGRDVVEVKARLVELESRLGKAHAQAVAREGHPALREFFEQLALQDEAHLELLRP